MFEEFEKWFEEWVESREEDQSGGVVCPVERLIVAKPAKRVYGTDEFGWLPGELAVKVGNYGRTT